MIGGDRLAAFQTAPICFARTTSSHHVTNAHHPRKLWLHQSSSAAYSGRPRRARRKTSAFPH
jgi:hypothetical protein